MCGIFGFALAKPIPLVEVFEVLERLEDHQYAGEETPVGGYGAGIATLRNGKLTVEKIGKTGDASPARELAKQAEATEASVLISHVRMPSPQFMQTAHLRETAQPYVASCHGSSAVASVHNGYIENYEALRRRLGEAHVLESESSVLIDSEVIPHCFEETLKVNGDVEEALHALQAMLEGRMAIALLQTGQKGSFLHFVHKGATRGLHLWTSNHGEVIFISRKETLTPYFDGLLSKGRFSPAVSVAWKEEKSIKLSYALKG
jgi:glucosamine 6-phosphate synthetase-like amidotransferase/phosphosugar isomerase protein